MAKERAAMRAGFPWALRDYAALNPTRAITISLVRFAPRLLDGHDNLPGLFKATVDQLAEELGLDDRDPRITWMYGQSRGGVRDYRVWVQITAGEHGSAALSALPPIRRKRAQAPPEASLSVQNAPALRKATRKRVLTGVEWP